MTGITPIAGVWMKIKHPEKIARARKRLGYTQTDLANLVRCSQQYVSLIERGDDTDCSEKLALAICRRLGLDVEDVFEERPLYSTAKKTSTKVGSRAA